jgi:hypothetical protein
MPLHLEDRYPDGSGFRIVDVMRSADELLKLAEDCRAQASITLDPDTKSAFTRLAHRYLKDVDDLQKRQSPSAAHSPVADGKPGSANGI